MVIILEPTRIKQSVYLLVPKSVAELVEIKANTKLSLTITKEGNKHILQYQFTTRLKS